jgi:membrane protein required for beta-lactamase induction
MDHQILIGIIALTTTIVIVWLLVELFIRYPKLLFSFLVLLMTWGVTRMVYLVFKPVLGFLPDTIIRVLS